MKTLKQQSQERYSIQDQNSARGNQGFRQHAYMQGSEYMVPAEITQQHGHGICNHQLNTHVYTYDSKVETVKPHKHQAKYRNKSTSKRNQIQAQDRKHMDETYRPKIIKVPVYKNSSSQVKKGSKIKQEKGCNADDRQAGTRCWLNQMKTARIRDHQVQVQTHTGNSARPGMKSRPDPSARLHEHIGMHQGIVQILRNSDQQASSGGQSSGKQAQKQMKVKAYTHTHT